MLEYDRGHGVLVALHGHGDDPATARAWGRGIAPPGWEVVAPGAPRDDAGVRSWFPTGPRGVDPPDLAAAVSRVADVVERVRSDGRPVVVVGFSQGGAVALSLARRGTRADGIIAICTFLPEVDDAGGAAPGSTESPPVIVIGADGDEDVPAFLGEDAAACLRDAGLTVESVTMAGGHAVSATVQARAAAWLVDTVGRGPKVTLGLPTERVQFGEELVSGAAVGELSVLYERLGFHALYVTDHPAPDDRWLASGGHHALEPTSVLSAAATCTERIKLHTHVYVLAYRNPFLAAKSLASVDVLSGGRLIVGVAAGYLRPEFRALGAEFEHRGERLDEALGLLPRIWSGESVAAEGETWSARGATSLPTPVQRPHPPLWIGGNTVSAMRRAVAHGQGWSPFPTPAGAESPLRTAAIADHAALRARMRRLRELCDEAGRTELPTVCFAPVSMAGYLEDPDAGLAPMITEIGELSEIGVDWVSLMVPGRTRAEVGERAGQLSEALGLH